MTVTAPLETGAGHQRLVIAYTLKQAIEKQPDILNAQQKITMSSSGTGVKQPSSTSSSPLSNRPNALFIGKPTFTSSDYVSINRELLSMHVFLFSFSFFRPFFLVADRFSNVLCGVELMLLLLSCHLVALSC